MHQPMLTWDLLRISASAQSIALLLNTLEIKILRDFSSSDEPKQSLLNPSRSRLDSTLINLLTQPFGEVVHCFSRVQQIWTEVDLDLDFGFGRIEFIRDHGHKFQDQRIGTTGHKTHRLDWMQLLSSRGLARLLLGSPDNIPTITSFELIPIQPSKTRNRPRF